MGCNIGLVDLVWLLDIWKYPRYSWPVSLCLLVTARSRESRFRLRAGFPRFSSLVSSHLFLANKLAGDCPIKRDVF